MMFVRNLTLLFILLGNGFHSVCAQQPGSTIEQQIIEDNHQLKVLPTNNRIPAPGFFKPGKPVGNIFSKTPSALMPGSIKDPQLRTDQAACKDSSFLKKFESPDRSYSFVRSAKTKDGSILVGGFGRNKTFPINSPWVAVVTKFDSLGNHIWSREISSDVADGVYIGHMKELSDGSLIITGSYTSNKLYYKPPAEYNEFFVCKLTAAGNFVWIKTYHTTLTLNCSATNLFINSIEEGANGDMLFAGTIWNCPSPKYLTAFKLNTNGDMQWKFALLPAPTTGDAYGADIFYEGSVVTLINKSSNIGSGTDNTVHTDLIKLSYANGTMISYKSWKIDMLYPASFYHSFTNAVSAVKLANGNYCVYGNTAGVLNYDSTTASPHFSVLEFNSNYDFVNGYTIDTRVAGNLDGNVMKVDKNKNVLYSDFSYLVYPDVDIYIGSIKNDQIVNQRKRAYRNQEVFYNNFEFFGDGSYVFINNLATIDQSSFTLEYSLLHNSDTGSTCLGMRNNFSNIEPVKYLPYSFDWGTTDFNPFYESNNQNTGAAPLTYTALPPCIQKGVCDTIKIHGKSVSCNYSEDLVFTGYKNPSCGGAVNWSMPMDAVQLFEMVNDTTLHLKLNKEWQGWLYAYITSSCSVVKDSILITALGSPGAVKLGADKQLCVGNTVLLNAGKGFASYIWNNGSSDSTLSVSAAGTYYVTVMDGCSNVFKDTIVITTAPAVPFNVGEDRTKCNSDTLHLGAPGGFINYSWSSNYNINAITSQNVIVQPVISTLYYVRAEKTPGCFVYDTVSVTVKTSPPIDLGADKSFCNGDSAIFNAGAGFSNYRWSNGSTTASTVVYKAGVYTVKATTVDGCNSYDTVRILNTWPNPAVHLDKDSGFCIGSIRKLMAGSFNSYLWQDGSNQSYFNVKGTGTFYVTVVDNNACVGSDTVHITKFRAAPSSFLPPDTAICNYVTLKLEAREKFTSYLWNDGSVSAALIITKPGTYWMQATDGNGCSGNDTIVVLSRQCVEGFHVPNAFTPGTGGRNDRFKPIFGSIVQQYQFNIYNRWGQLVFGTNDPGAGWDGKFKGIIQDANIYIWTCSYQLEGETLKKDKGSFTLVK